MFTCPVCGWNGMDEPPTHYNICDCCGTEFENDDDDVPHAELRARWLARGAPWFNTFTPAPPDFSPARQIAALLARA